MRRCCLRAAGQSAQRLVQQCLQEQVQHADSPPPQQLLPASLKPLDMRVGAADDQMFYQVLDLAYEILSCASTILQCVYEILQFAHGVLLSVDAQNVGTKPVTISATCS